MDSKTGKIEIGQFLIPNHPPRQIEDIKDYKQGISDEVRKAIHEWMKKPNQDALRVGMRGNNFQSLCLEWLKNEK